MRSFFNLRASSNGRIPVSKTVDQGSNPCARAKEKTMSLASFIKGSIIEFKEKVEWPKWPELQSSTIVVSVATLILSVFTFGVDELFSKSLRNIIAMLIGVFN